MPLTALPTRLAAYMQQHAANALYALRMLHLRWQLASVQRQASAHIPNPVQRRVLANSITRLHERADALSQAHHRTTATRRVGRAAA